MFTPRQLIQQSYAKAQHTHNKQNIQIHTNFQKQVRQNGRYTNYNTYRKTGGKNWKAFK